MNIFVENITYLTIEELKEAFSIFNDKDDNDLQILIRRAEKNIDNIIWKYGEKKEKDQKTIFPTKKDNIPLEIKQAAALLCKNIFSYKENNIKTESKREKRRWNEYNFSNTYFEKQENTFTKINKYLDEEIYNLLTPFLEEKNINTRKSSFFRT